jgi:two-component system nitrogen regulation sensor histidine kinase NtrY
MDKLGAERKERARRKRERIIILLTILAVGIITYLESQVVTLAQALPLGASLLLFALINLNIVFLLLLLFLIFRNLLKLILESRRRIWGARLRTRLVLAFAVLSIAPSTVLFFAAFQFVGSSMDYWFNVQVKNSLEEALDLEHSYTDRLRNATAHFSRQIAAELDRESPPDLPLWLEEALQRYDLSALQVFDRELDETAFITQSGMSPVHFGRFPQDLLAQALHMQEARPYLQKEGISQYAAVVSPFKKGLLVAYQTLPGQVARQAGMIAQGLRSYMELEGLKGPYLSQQYVTLSIVALLVIFAATWFGLYLSKSITEPLMEVAEGTQRVAEGDYDFFIDRARPDEIGSLINAFNRMTADLKTSKARLDEAQVEMRAANQELEQRRRYMEIVLNNVNAGVVATDAGGRISTFNPSAERMLKISAGQVTGRPWRAIIEPENMPMAEEIIAQLSLGLNSLDRQLNLNIAGESLSLMFHLATLYDENRREMGRVVVFEDLTELEKAQRMAAWREVARRIAHEVKNPLTPIKLSAQRLIRRYEDKLPEKDLNIFKECTSTIINQVEEIRSLVNEFSNFARLPGIRPAQEDMEAIIQEALNLFRPAHQDVEYILEIINRPPRFNLDKEQMSRALINLLDNATAAVQAVDPPRRIVLRLSYDEILKMARLEVEDNGPGVPPGLRLRLFEPYFSTKHGGTGLGLAIVSSIITDHHGYIRVQDNQPQGVRMVIELPVGRV